MMSRVSRSLQNLSIRKKLSILVGILVFNLIAVIALSILGMGILSQVRAYVGGEGLWAKAQKNAIYSLSKYAYSGHEKDYQDYLAELKTPLGDRKARIELSRPKPDLRISDQGFLEGQNHPEDVRGMAKLFLRFQRFRLINQAIQIWGEADSVLLELQEFGEAFHDLTAAQRARPEKIAAFISRLDRFNERLTKLENRFSSTMGEAARWAQRLLLWAMVLGSVTLGLLSLAVALAISRGIVRGVTLISEAAGRAAQGELSVRVSLEGSDELGRLASAFNAMTEGLSRIDQLKNNFISTVSHELRTPLTLNLAPLESLRSGEYGPVREQQAALLDVMYNNCMRLLQMVNGMLDFSKIQAGKMQVEMEPTDPAALCRSILDDFSPAVTGKGLSLEARIEADIPLLMLDRYLFERIVFNLLSNAVKFTPQGGSISVSLSLIKGMIQLDVADTGIGISEKDAKNLFQKFSQAEASSTRRFEGTGLGLALVKECAQLMGGSVRLQSSPGSGSRFSVSLPANKAAEGQAARPRQQSVLPSVVAVTAPLLLPAESGQPAAAGGLPRVLIAEDNPELAAYIASLLSPSAELRHCSDGETALALARSWEPDLLLSDVMMPKKDGVTLCRELKANPECASIPVILLTALTSQQDLLRGWEAGADDYLFKPFHPRELQARVRTMLAMVAWRRRSELHRKREEVLELFTRIASHDLKAPLRRISSYSELLMNDAGDRLDAGSREHLNAIARGARQVHALIEALLQFSRLGSPDHAFKDCDLGAVLNDVVRLLEPDLKPLDARLDLGEMPQLKAVPEQIFALFQNLISNSLKYRSPLRRPEISIHSERSGDHWQFTVADNGMGFDPVHQKEIFDLFKRLHESEKIPGEGMGLAIAKKIVELHGGRIWAEPVSGQGCSIRFTLMAGGPGKFHE